MANRLPFQPARAGTSNTSPAPEENEPAAPRIVSVISAPTPPAIAVVPEYAVSGGQLGGVFGRVTLSGTPRPEVPIDLGPSCGPIAHGPATTRHYVVSPDGGLANVLVFLHRAPLKDGTVSAEDEALAKPLPSLSSPPPPRPALLDQVGCMFEPYVLAIRQGQELQIRNSDPVLHNIHATPRINKEFNFGQPMRGVVHAEKFDRGESFFRIKCDVHPWMFAYVSVVAHPYFAITDTNGVYQIPPGVADGTYYVTARHLKAGRQSNAVTIKRSIAPQIDFTFQPDGLGKSVAESR